MPLEQLQQYRGISPKPDDFEAYWRRGIAEVATVPLRAEYRPAAIPSEETCFGEYEFDSVGGARICAKYLRKKRFGKMPCVLVFHGYMGASGDYFDKLAFVSEGYAVLAMDCRGQGGRSEDSIPVKGMTVRGFLMRGVGDPDPDKMYYRNVFLDTLQLVRLAQSLPEIDADRIYTYGASQGGALSVACAALAGKQIAKSAVLCPFLSDFRRVFEMDCHEQTHGYGELAYYLRWFAPKLGQEEAVFRRLGYLDLSHHAPNISAKVLFGTALLDPLCPPSTQFAIYNNLRTEKKMEIYPSHSHEWMPGFMDEVLCFFYGES